MTETTEAEEVQKLLERYPWLFNAAPSRKEKRCRVNKNLPSLRRSLSLRRSHTLHASSEHTDEHPIGEDA